MPLPKYRGPVSPAVLYPELKRTVPVTPEALAGAVSIVRSPLLDCVLKPVIIAIEPPDVSADVPA
jgi:hypothetical protein